MIDPWLFADAREVAVFTVRSIVERERPVLLVNHDSEDGGWQFLTGEALDMADARLVSLAEMVQLDPTLAAIADLPLGWEAARARVDDEWHRSESASD
jgi:hypothetical protein